MPELRWTYSNPRGLTQWYGHVDYYGSFVIGQWFALDAETGRQHWARAFSRPNTLRYFAQDVIIASETRSDGPWTADFGIYAIDAKTGCLLWVNHQDGLRGQLLRWFDNFPSLTNLARDTAKTIVGDTVVTLAGRTLDLHSGRPCQLGPAAPATSPLAVTPAQTLYSEKSLEVGGYTIRVQGSRADFAIACRDANENEVWRFAARDQRAYVDGNYFSYRLRDGQIFIILRDTPDALSGKPDPANYQLGVLDVASGACALQPLEHAKQSSQCRIEAIRAGRILISSNGTQLAEYAFAPNPGASF